MSVKNQAAKTAKEVSKKAKEKRVDIGDATFKMVTEKISIIQSLNSQLEHEKQKLNEVITACIESAGVEIKDGVNTAFDQENKQFIIS